MWTFFLICVGAVIAGTSFMLGMVYGIYLALPPRNNDSGYVYQTLKEQRPQPKG